MYKILNLLSLFFLFSCTSQEEWNEIQYKKLQLQYGMNVTPSLSKKLIRFLNDKELISGEKQTLRLTKEKNTYYVHLISNLEDYAKNITMDELSLLSKLQNEMQYLVSKKESIQLLLCDKKFNILRNIND